MSSRNLVWQDRIKLLTVLMVLLTLFAVTFWIQGLLLSVVLAIIGAYMLNPFVARLEARGQSRFLATSIVFGTFSFLLIGLSVAVSPYVGRQVSALQSELPKYLSGTTELLESLQVNLARLSGGLFEIRSTGNFSDWISKQSQTLLENLPNYLSSSASVLLLAPLICFFLMRDGRVWGRQILQLVPNRRFEMALNLQYQINDQIASYIRARIIEAAIVALVVFIGLMAIGFPYATVLAVFAGVTNLIPYIGPIVGAVPAVAIALINQESDLILLLTILVYVIAQLVDMFFIIPLVVAKIVDLHPLTVILAVIIGAEVLGILGMIISIPIFSAAKVTLGTLYRHLTDDAG
jgi:putative permease